MGGQPVVEAQIHAATARVLLANGEREAGQAAFERMRASLQRTINTPEVDGFRFVPIALVSLDTAIVDFADDGYLRACFHYLQTLKEIAPITNFGVSSQIPYANIALALDEVAVAETAFAGNLAWAEREGADIIGGRCHLGLAEVASRRGQTGEALRHLDSAAALFQKHGAKLFLEQVIAKKLELQGLSDADVNSSIVALNASVQSEHPDLSRQAAPDGTVTILFSDIEGSTALNVELGDEGWMELLAEHNRLVREAIRRHHGFEVKTEGDAFMVAFQSARDALRCAIDTQKALANHNETAERPVRVRIGLHTGEPVRQGDDFYGTHVVLAARIASQAAGGDILVSALLRELVTASREFELTPRPAVALKGLPGEHVVYAVGWS